MSIQEKREIASSHDEITAGVTVRKVGETGGKRDFPEWDDEIGFENTTINLFATT